MQTEGADVHATLSFGTRRYDFKLLAIFVVVAPIVIWAGNWLMIALCVGFGLFQLIRVVVAGSALELSPKGVRYDYDGIKYSIPWREIRNVASIDIPERRGGVHRDVTVLTISRRFYEKRIHNRFGKLLNPSRDEYFNVGDKTVQIAMHHAFMGLKPEELRAAVEARWRAFGGARAAAMPPAEPSP